MKHLRSLWSSFILIYLNLLRCRDSECGLIVACVEDEKSTLPFLPADSDLRTMAKFGDQVRLRSTLLLLFVDAEVHFVFLKSSEF